MDGGLGNGERMKMSVRSGLKYGELSFSHRK